MIVRLNYLYRNHLLQWIQQGLNSVRSVIINGSQKELITALNVEFVSLR
jgi:hypothetical protein